jgi:hypothetical protein
MHLFFSPDYMMLVKMKTMTTEWTCKIKLVSNYDGILVYLMYKILV